MHFFLVHWTEPFGSGKEVEIVTYPAQEIVEKPSEHDQNDVVEKDENISLQDIEEKDSVNEALKVKDAPELQPFFKMLRMGVPVEAVKLKMSRELTVSFNNFIRIDKQQTDCLKGHPKWKQSKF